MEFVQNFTPPDFQAKNFTPSISPNFNSFNKKKHKKWVKMGKFTPLAKILHSRREWREWQIPTLCMYIWFVAGETKTLACLSPWYQPALSKVKSFMHARLLKNTYYARLAHVEICRETTYVAGWGITKTKFIHGSKIQVNWLALLWDL